MGDEMEWVVMTLERAMTIKVRKVNDIESKEGGRLPVPSVSGIQEFLVSPTWQSVSTPPGDPSSTLSIFIPTHSVLVSISLSYSPRDGHPGSGDTSISIVFHSISISTIERCLVDTSLV